MSLLKSLPRHMALKLVTECEQLFPSSRIDDDLKSDLIGWEKFSTSNLAEKINEMVSADISNWSRIIADHRSAKHPWYDFLDHKASIEDFRQFFYDEAKMPDFVELLLPIRENLSEQSAIKAITTNISDELGPPTHHELFVMMVDAICQGSIRDNFCTKELAETNLVFYHGFFINHWFAVGALYATEMLVPRRATLMRRGLKRLGFSDSVTRFLKIHAESDEEHARDWLEQIIVPCIAGHRDRLCSVVSGIVLRLSTSEVYLDQLLKNVNLTRGVVCDD